MYVFEDKEKCSGCTACMHSCPAEAITMKVDSEGFKYPLIDEEKCIDCNICRQVCPFKKDYDISNNLDEPKIYAVKNKDNEVRTKSSSGGIFSVLAENILNKDGIVYGVAFSNNFTVKHMRITNKKQLNKLRGSKYVQSDLSDIFLTVEKDLKENKYVLFSGTPCQIAGLNAYLDDELSEELLLVDLICHGTPSPLIWEKYIKLLQKYNENELICFSFRNKKSGWHNSKLLAKFKNGDEIFNDYLLDSFNAIFYSHTTLRPSCHSCVYTNFERPGDITLGDFWGIENHMPDFDDDRGVSLVLLNNKKGEKIFSEINDYIIYRESSKDKAKQRNLQEPTKRSPKRKQFWEDFNENGYESVAKKYTTYGFKNRIKKYLKNILNFLEF